MPHWNPLGDSAPRPWAPQREGATRISEGPASPRLWSAPQPGCRPRVPIRTAVTCALPAWGRGMEKPPTPSSRGPASCRPCACVSAPRWPRGPLCIRPISQVLEFPRQCVSSHGPLGKERTTNIPHDSPSWDEELPPTSQESPQTCLHSRSRVRVFLRLTDTGRAGCPEAADRAHRGLPGGGARGEGRGTRVAWEEGRSSPRRGRRPANKHPAACSGETAARQDGLPGGEPRVGPGRWVPLLQLV